MQLLLTRQQVETIDLYMRHPAARVLITPLESDEGAVLAAILQEDGTNIDTVRVSVTGTTTQA